MALPVRKPAAPRAKAKPKAKPKPCPKPVKGRKAPKRPKGCVPAKAKAKPKVTPKAVPVALPKNPAVSAKRPLPVPAPPIPIALPPVAPDAPMADAGVTGDPAASIPVLDGFGPAQAERLLWRAGFGPRPGDRERLVAMGLEAAVASLVRPTSDARLVGPEPTDSAGAPLRPEEAWGHDHCWWLDRMVRSDQPLVERMTLVWHDWFATSLDGVGSRPLMLAQNATLRRHALGCFADLARDVTTDPAMLVWLDGVHNTRRSPNENHARELMELFTLGANRGAYAEQDVKELARAMTGWRADWREPAGWQAFRFDATRHDAGTKTVFGRTGAFGTDDAVRLCLEHPAHASFFVAKLWSHFVAGPPDAATRAALEATYVASGLQIAPVLEAILKHPQLYAGGAMAKPPVVYAAGLLRALGKGVTQTDWAWLCDQAGQTLFTPPHVFGWDDAAWLDTSTWRGRWNLVVYAIKDQRIDPWNGTPYDPRETPEAAVARVLAWAGHPTVTTEQQAALLTFARTAMPAVVASWQQSPFRAMRQNALRLLLLTAADFQVC